MTPMIDMVFLLIVFFTLVLNFAAADQNERVKLPVSELAQPPDQPPSEVITLHVLTDGHVIYNGTDYTLQELQNPIREQLRVRKFLNIPPEKIMVIIRADALCESGHVFDVTELCQSFNLFQFVYRARQPER